MQTCTIDKIKEWLTEQRIYIRTDDEDDDNDRYVRIRYQLANILISTSSDPEENYVGIYLTGLSSCENDNDCNDALLKASYLSNKLKVLKAYVDNGSFDLSYEFYFTDEASLYDNLHRGINALIHGRREYRNTL